MAITAENYATFQQAYDYFNRELFSARLPEVLITLQRKSHAYGYFSPERFEEREGKSTTHELALNPDAFEQRTDRDICATLVHEMVHVWQQAYGDPPRRSYHDREWAKKMLEVGLQPTDTGQPDGKQTGQKMTHLIQAGGPYDQAYRRLASSSFRLSWQSRRDQPDAHKKRASKTKFTCTVCQQNVWGKPDSLIVCGVCYENDIIVTLVPQKQDSAWPPERW